MQERGIEYIDAHSTAGKPKLDYYWRITPNTFLPKYMWKRAQIIFQNQYSDIDYRLLWAASLMGLFYSTNTVVRFFFFFFWWNHIFLTFDWQNFWSDQKNFVIFFILLKCRIRLVITQALTASHVHVYSPYFPRRRRVSTMAPFYPILCIWFFSKLVCNVWYASNDVMYIAFFISGILNLNFF